MKAGRPKSKKIVFFGLFGQQNIGNDCTLQAILHQAMQRLPEAEIICSCTGPEEISQRYGIQTFPIRSDTSRVWAGTNSILIKLIRKILIRIPKELYHWVKVLWFLKGIDMLISPGTGLLVDHTTGPFGFPYYVFKWSLIAKVRRCKLLFVSIGAGPIYHPLSKWFIKTALSLADYRSYRDNFSKKYIGSIGFETNDDPVYPDLAFSLSRAIMPESGNREKRRPDIGIGIIDYHGPSSIQRQGGSEERYHEYIDKLESLITWLCENNYTVRVLIGDVRYDSRVKRDLLDKLRRRGFEPCQIISEPISSLGQLLSQLEQTDLVVSPRFHNIILAFMLNKPVVSISYNEKFDYLMADIGLLEYCHNIDSLDIEALIDQIVRLESNAKNVKSKIQEKIEEYRMALDEQYSIIFENDRIPKMVIGNKYSENQNLYSHKES